MLDIFNYYSQLSSLPRSERELEGRTSEELRALWKFAGRQVIILIRMEKENVSLQERQKEQEIRRMKLNYDEIVACGNELDTVWEELIGRAADVKNEEIFNAIRRGVPKMKRGEVWLMLAKNYMNSHRSTVDLRKFPFYNTAYPDLLRQLTEHQHAIFIDIGRTFPRHEFFKSAFGMGQLALFNLLKGKLDNEIATEFLSILTRLISLSIAYSIVDPEVGYTQGTAFICGILLLHVS